jgi:very-short-patch-repair endonuclease
MFPLLIWGNKKGLKMKVINRAKLKNVRRLNRNKPTPWEWKLWQHIKQRQIRGHRFRRQVSINNYVADFCCLSIKLVIELDGSGHLKPIQMKKDKDRDKEISELGFTIMRFWNNEIDDNLEGVLEQITNQCEKLE